MTFEERDLVRYFLCLLFLFPLVCAAQKQEFVDFKNCSSVITPNLDAKSLKASAIYQFEIIKDVDSIFLDAVDMQITSVNMPQETFKYSYDGKRIVLYNTFKSGKSYDFEITYEVFPKKTVYFTGFQDDLVGNEQVWTQGQGKYTSHWLPSLDDMNDKIVFDIGISLESDFDVISNGRLANPPNDLKENKDWSFDMWKPMSSYLTAFAIGNFDKKVIVSKSGIPIELYYEPRDSSNFEPTYRYSKEIFDFLEEEIGVKYPWQNYKQVPVQDFLYAGMENTTCTIFSNQYVIDSIAFVDKNYVNINAHELAHQWFGNLVTEESGDHHWLHEGFATFYAYLAEKALFGEDHFYWKLYQTAKTLHNLSENEGGEALTDPNANSLTFYEKGAWALVVLRERLGDKAFQRGIKNYLNTYAFKNATISNFLREMEMASNTDLRPFREQWLESEEFQWKEVKELLMSKNEWIKLFFEFQDQTNDTTVIDEKDLIGLWAKEAPIPFKREFLFKYGTLISDPFLNKISACEALEVRQAIAQAIPKVPKELQSSFETMLKDESYITQETALFKLWEAFPDKQKGYLDQLDGVVGLPNKNIRLLWLTLALITEGYQPQNKKMFYEELNDYTNLQYNFEVRQLAFQYLFQIRAFNQNSLENLLQASNHYVWQFKKSSRNLLRELNRSDEGKARLRQWRIALSQEQNQLLDSILNP